MYTMAHKLYALIFLLISCTSVAEQNSKLSNTINELLTKSVKGHGDKTILVFDNLYSQEVVRAFSSLVSYGSFAGSMSAWEFNYKDYYQQIRTPNASNHLAWVAPMNPEFFMKSVIWQRISEVLQECSGGKVYFPYDVSVSMTRRLDFTTVYSAESDDELLARIFLNSDFKKNDYGETVFYEADGEVLTGVHPKQGRLIVWNSSIPFIYKPPAMSYLQGQYAVTLKLSPLKEKFEIALNKAKEEIQRVEEYDRQDLPTSDGAALPNYDVSKYETTRAHDRKGREVVVFDGLMDTKDLDALRLFLVQYNSGHRYQGYDTSSDEEHDNVSWITTIKVDSFVKTRLWKLVKKIAHYLSGLNEWYPYDVSMNIIRSSHYTRIHQDCEEHEHEYTFLMYLTPDWEANNYGETVFFDMTGEEQFEWIASVRPRYGRIVMFRGIIPHSARPPSPGFNGVRYTFATKVSRTRHIAAAKRLQEACEDAEPGTEEHDLWEKLSSDHYDESAPYRSTELLEEMLNERRRKSEENFDEMKRAFVDVVMNRKLT